MNGELSLGIEHLADVELIGSGGFSVVYAATHTLFDRRVAVKVLTSAISDSDRRRFERECRVMGRLSGNPNVVTVFHADYTSQGRPYLIMELVEGGTLNDRLASTGPIPWPEAVDIAMPVCGALAHAHREGILHRDVKPENVLLDDGVPKLADFGIARLRDSTGRSSTQVSASWLHTPPETFENQRDERSDLYSLASTLYTSIAGNAPFWREGEESLYPLMNRLVNEPVPDLPSHLAPADLRSFLVRAMAKDPAQRPQTAPDFALSLAEIRGVTPQGGAGPDYAPAFEPTLVAGGLLATPRGPGGSPPAGGPGGSSPAGGFLAATGGPVLAAGGWQRGPVPAPAGGPATTEMPAASSAGRAAALGTVPPTGPTPWPTAGEVGHLPPGRPAPPGRSPLGLLAVLLLVALAGAAGVFVWLSGRDGGTSPGDGAGTEAGGAQVVPSVVGLTEAEATAELDAAGIEVASVDREASASAGEGIVIAQSPSAGTAASSVELTVSSGQDLEAPSSQPVVPDVVGLTEEQAESRLEALGITASVADRASSDTVADGVVISQDPAQGAEASLVQLTISTGAPGAEAPVVPDVEGLTEAEAVSRLEGEGINASIGSRVASGTAPEGVVIDQSPTAGARATEVALTISAGGTVSFDSVTFSPSSPHVFVVGEELGVSIAYRSTYDGNVRIWARPTSGDYSASGSAQIAPGSGTQPQSFSLSSPGTVTRIRVYAADAATDELVSEQYVDVSFTWEAGPAPPATPTQLAPADGSVFDHFPRETTLSWTSVPGAVSYSIETQFFGGSWSSGASAGDIASTSYTFDFVGAQPGRWRVWATNAAGEDSPKSPWWTFEYTV